MPGERKLERAEEQETPGPRGASWGVSILVGFLVFLPLLVAIQQYAIAWDEGFTFERLDRLRPWWNGAVGNRFERANLERHWRFSKEEPDGHGPFYGLLSLAGFQVAHGWLPPPACYRVGSIALFAVAVAAAFRTLTRFWDDGSALLAVTLLATLPRVLPEVCYALIDGPLFSLALLAWCCFVQAEQTGSWRATLGFGIALGLAMGTKLTGWFLPVPYLAAVVLGWGKSWRIVTMGLFVAALAVLAVNVGWWYDPFDGLRRFFASNLTRQSTTHIPTLFWGQRYGFALPWYNTMVWTVIAVPAGTLLLGLWGIAVASWNWRADRLALLLMLHWGLLMVVRAMPQAPGHDGTRQINISLGFLALLAGYGFHALTFRPPRPRESTPADSIKPGLSSLPRKFAGTRWVAAVIAFCAVYESAFAALRYHPYQLSYYSPLIGGLPGAARCGFEPTYFWDSLTPEVLEWIHRNTPPGNWMLFRHHPTSFDYLTSWGYLKVVHRPPSGPHPRALWMVMQHRPGLFLPHDEWLIANGQWVYRKTLFGVPVISIYRYDEYLLAWGRFRDTKQETNTQGSSAQDLDGGIISPEPNP